MIYEYCNLGVKTYFHIFFTNFNETLQKTAYKRTPFTKSLLIFLLQNAKKYNILEKLIRKKI